MLTTTTRFVFAIALAAAFVAPATTIAATEYKSVPFDQFEADAFEMVGQNVEVFGDLNSLLPISPNAVADIVDPRFSKGQKAYREGRIDEAARILEEVGDPDKLPRVRLEFTGIAPTTLQWFARNRCTRTCDGVYFRGTVVLHRDAQLPALQLHEASHESLATGRATKGEVAAAIAERENSGPKKNPLPPGTTPSHQGFQAWAAQAPSGSREYDRSQSVWNNMVARSNEMKQRDGDLVRAIIRGPERRADYQTYYRSTRDTALAGLFERYPYKDTTTIWPRVAVLVEEAPRGAGSQIAEYSRGQTAQDMCWRLRATIWPDAFRSVPIAPFNWCFSEIRFNVAYAQVPTWGVAQKSNMLLARQSTGAQRTEGPVPPYSPLPRDASGSDDFGKQFSYSTAMVGNVLLDMGFNYGLADGRVWFNVGR